MKRLATCLMEGLTLGATYWRRSLLVTAALAAVGFVALLVLSPWDSAPRARAADPTHFIAHSAKYVCGTASGADKVVPGTYTTAVNVHNFTANTLNPAGGDVTVYKKAVEALAEGYTGMVGEYVPIPELPSDYAFEIDCADIYTLLGYASPPVFSKGFVEISYAGSTPVVDVVAVYTGADTSTHGHGQSMDVERIEAEVHAWDKPDPDPTAWYTYSAKFVCGTAGPAEPVVPGLYRTAVNVHNPWEAEDGTPPFCCQCADSCFDAVSDPSECTDKGCTAENGEKICNATNNTCELSNGISVYKKAVRAQPESVTPMAPSSWVPYTIGPNAAFEIDCNEIVTWLYPDGGAPSFLKGFVVIESPNELDVVGVYTTERIVTDVGKGFALDIEAVPYTSQAAPVID